MEQIGGIHMRVRAEQGGRFSAGAEQASVCRSGQSRRALEDRARADERSKIGPEQASACRSGRSRRAVTRRPEQGGRLQVGRAEQAFMCLYNRLAAHVRAVNPRHPAA